ncbi:MAG: hypothetical protein IT198_15955 [Acidimicrobiia bacterium]|nr:hypothetical protein [Acidimicrobiia bacterium]
MTTGKGRTSTAVRPWPAVIVLAGTVPVVAGAAWVLRRWSLSAGIPCTEQGPYDCAIDGGVYAAILVILGLAITAVTALSTWVALRFVRDQRLAWVPVGLGWAGWIALSVTLLIGAARG